MLISSFLGIEAKDKKNNVRTLNKHCLAKAMALTKRALKANEGGRQSRSDHLRGRRGRL